MPMFISLLSFGCFAGAGATFFWHDGRYLELLVMCGVVLFAAAEIASAILTAQPRQAPADDMMSAEFLRELEKINDRLVKVQLATPRPLIVAALLEVIVGWLASPSVRARL
jgi:hypothetical protein